MATRNATVAEDEAAIRSTLASYSDALNGGGLIRRLKVLALVVDDQRGGFILDGLLQPEVPGLRHVLAVEIPVRFPAVFSWDQSGWGF
jgi:hypothetical protein